MQKTCSTYLLIFLTALLLSVSAMAQKDPVIEEHRHQAPRHVTFLFLRSSHEAPSTTPLSMPRGFSFSFFRSLKTGKADKDLLIKAGYEPAITLMQTNEEEEFTIAPNHTHPNSNKAVPRLTFFEHLYLNTGFIFWTLITLTIMLSSTLLLARQWHRK